MNAIVQSHDIRVERAALDAPASAAEIDRWLLGRADGTPFHRPAWLGAVARATGQRAIMLLARDMSGAIAGLLPLTFINSRLFGRALVSSGFAVDGGILGDDAVVAQALADACWTLARDLGCPSAELRGGPVPAGWTEKTGAYLGFTKPLAADDEAELLAVPRKHRAELRKGLANDLDVRFGRDAELRAIHYRLYAISVHNLGTPVFPRALFDEVLDAFGADADIILVSKDGRPLSSVLSLYHGDACMPYWQGATAEARTARANEVAYYRLMCEARARGYSRFDFGRSKVGTGPAAWKKSWGFEPVPLRYATRSADGAAARDVNPLSPRYRRKVELWKKLPLPLANLIGPYLARGLG